MGADVKGSSGQSRKQKLSMILRLLGWFLTVECRKNLQNTHLKSLLQVLFGGGWIVAISLKYICVYLVVPEEQMDVSG